MQTAQSWAVLGLCRRCRRLLLLLLLLLLVLMLLLRRRHIGPWSHVRCMERVLRKRVQALGGCS